MFDFPDPPVNVIIMDMTGKKYPVDCLYIGKRKGLRTWQVIMPRGFVGHVTNMTIDMLPERTQVRLPGYTAERR